MKETQMNETIMTTSGNYTTIRCEELARLKAIEKAAKRMAECLDVYRWYEDDAAALEEYEKAKGGEK